jgi:hypothetical protein
LESVLKNKGHVVKNVHLLGLSMEVLASSLPGKKKDQLFGWGEVEEFEFALRVFPALPSRSQDFEQDHLTHKPHLHAGSGATHGRPSFSTGGGVHVEDRLPGFVGKNGSRSEHLLDAFQSVDHGNDLIPPAGFRSNDKATAVLCSSNEEDHGSRDIVIFREVLNSLRKPLARFQAQYKNSADLSFAVFHDAGLPLRIPSICLLSNSN